VDDFLLMANSAEKLHVHTQILVDILQELGSVLNTKKWFLELSQIVECLGCVVNSCLMTILLPEENMEKVKECHHLLNKPRASGRVLAHLIALITSTTCTSHSPCPTPL